MVEKTSSSVTLCTISCKKDEPLVLLDLSSYSELVPIFQ